MEEYTRFVAVADVGNITAAARKLNLSQPALSRSLSILERRFRTMLFHRGPGGVTLTRAGQVLYDHASRALRLLHDAEERIEYEGIGGNLSLSICAGDSWGNAVLPRIIQQFTEAHPEIYIRLDIIGSEARMAGLAAGDYELSYGISLPRQELLEKVDFRPILRAPYMIYCAKDHPLLARTSTPSSEQLLEFDWVKHKFEYDYDPAQWQVTRRRYKMSTNTMLSTLELVANSRLLIATSTYLREVFAQHSVVVLGLDPLSPQLLSGLHTLRDAELSSAAKLFSSFCHPRCSALFPDNAVASYSSRP